MININILVLNSGSSSLKYKLLNMENETVLAKGICERIGLGDSLIKQSTKSGKKFEKKVPNINNHKEAFLWIENMLTDDQFGIIKSMDRVSAVGHRVVHGGEYFSKPAIIDDKVEKIIEKLIPLAPLHNAAHLEGIRACQELLSDSIPQVAVFDTSFYSNIPKEAYIFPIPYEYYEKYGIRKYGFHGTSHRFVSEKYCELAKKDFNNIKIISCHLGNGSSITAINNGVAVETSMGLTPLGGIMMGTRSGDIDPSVILSIAEREHMNASQINSILNKKSGLLGVSGLCSDDRIITVEEGKGNKRAKLAHKMMVYQITQFIGAYIAVLKGFDALIFTGGIGENQWMHRENVCNNLSFMGLKIDTEKNKLMVDGKEGKISSDDSFIDVFVIPTDEELSIARDTLKLLKK